MSSYPDISGFDSDESFSEAQFWFWKWDAVNVGQLVEFPRVTVNYGV